MIVLEKIPEDVAPTNLGVKSIGLAPALATGTSPGDWPPGAELQRIAFVAERSPEQTVLFEFSPVIRRRAILVGRNASPNSETTREIEVLAIPTAGEDDVALLERVQAWVETDAGDVHPRGQMMSLQGARIFWSRTRIAIFAAADRLATIRKALIENAYYEAELRDLEQTLGEAWPQLEADMPLAFEFDERSVGKRKQLRRNFEKIMSLRARLARLMPFVHCPHLHPPTLASQVEERFRERNRTTQRHEFLSEQSAVFENVYETCGQRAGDYMSARKGHILEWIIIVLLGAQILFTAFEFMTATTP